MAVVGVNRNTTAVNKLQVAIKYIFDLAVRNVMVQIASYVFKGVHICFSHDVSKSDRNC